MVPYCGIEAIDSISRSMWMMMYVLIQSSESEMARIARFGNKIVLQHLKQARKSQRHTSRNSNHC